MRLLHIAYKDYTITKLINDVISIRRTDTGLYEVTVSEPILYRDTIQKLFFHGWKEELKGDIGKPGLEGDINIPGVKGDIGNPGLKY